MFPIHVRSQYLRRRIIPYGYHAGSRQRSLRQLQGQILYGQYSVLPGRSHLQLLERPAGDLSLSGVKSRVDLKLSRQARQHDRYLPGTFQLPAGPVFFSGQGQDITQVKVR